MKNYVAWWRPCSCWDWQGVKSKPLIAVGMAYPGEYGYPYYGGAYAYPYYYHGYYYHGYRGPYDRDHYWDRHAHFEQHRWHGNSGWGRRDHD